MDKAINPVVSLYILNPTICRHLQYDGSIAQFCYILKEHYGASAIVWLRLLVAKLLLSERLQGGFRRQCWISLLKVESADVRANVFSTVSRTMMVCAWNPCFESNFSRVICEQTCALLF